MVSETLSKFGDPELVARLVARISISDNGCWMWTGCIGYRGYGRFSIKNKDFLAHRLTFRCAFGNLPELLDHIVCDTRRCVNPFHLISSNNCENVLRGTGITAKNLSKTHCAKGHPFDVRNTRVVIRKGTERLRRKCRKCGCLYQAKIRAIRKAADRALDRGQSQRAG